MRTVCMERQKGKLRKRGEKSFVTRTFSGGASGIGATASSSSSSSSSTDFCHHEPCMMRGKCVSRLDRYECHCYARYSGNNCEIDNGRSRLSDVSLSNTRGFFIRVYVGRADSYPNAFAYKAEILHHGGEIIAL